MKRRIFTFGTIAGLVIIVVNTISLETGHGQVWLGLLVMLIAFSSIFVAIRQHRDDTLGGVISLRTAFLMGLGITAVASVVYVAVWEAYLIATDFRFLEDYAKLAKDASTAEEFITQYKNPFFRLPMTFLEVFPVGLLVTLVSAAILRNHPSAGDKNKQKKELS